jgi:hypothetical protein
VRLRGVLTGWLSLVVLYVVVQTAPADRLSGLAGDVTRLINRALDPHVAGLPDRSSGAPPAAAAPAPPPAGGSSGPPARPPFPAFSAVSG